MKIALDAQSTVGKKTGLGYYTQNLIREFSACDEFDFYYYKDSSKTSLNTLSRMKWETVTLPQRAKKDGIDLFHVPGFAGPYFKGRFKKITTVHDMIGLIYPGNLAPVSRFYWQRWLPACVKNSDIIIAISESTKRDIVRFLDVPGERIKVILEAAEENFKPLDDRAAFEKVSQKYGLPREFILSVGTVEPRKNLPGLVEAFASYIKERGRDIDLVIAGKKDWGYGRVRKRIDEKGISSRVKFTGYVEDEDMPLIYNMAKFFVFPSFYEGFGLPVLEAFSCGKAVVSSNTSSLPEIAGDAAILVDPENVKDMKEAIGALDTNASLREGLSRKALRRAGLFSWERTASETLKVYREALRTQG